MISHGRLMTSYSTIESLTGGALAALFTSQDDASGYYVGGMIAYHDSIKSQLGVNKDQPYDSLEMAASLAEHTYIEADVVISTTGYIDRSYAYCILIDGQSIVKHATLTKEQLKMPRDQRQCDIARCILQNVFFHTRDVRLLAASGLLSHEDWERLKELLFRRQVHDCVLTYTDTVKAITDTDKIIDKIPTLLATMPELAILISRMVQKSIHSDLRDRIIEYLLGGLFLSDNIDDVVHTLEPYLDGCADITEFTPIEDPNLYTINMFDDGNSCYKKYTNRWRLTHTNNKGKVSLCNRDDPTVRIHSISEWKIAS